MAKSVDRFWTEATFDLPNPPVLSRTSSDGVLLFEYREDAPGSLPPQVNALFSFVIPISDEPLRVIADRDGRTERLTMKPDDIAVSPAGSKTGWQWMDPSKCMIIHINPPAMKRFVQTELKVLSTGGQFDDVIFFHDAEVRQAAERMYETLVSDELGADVMFDALARMFLVLLVKRYGKPQKVDATFDTHFSADNYARVVEYIEGHLDQKISPADLAADQGMSEAAFSRKFKARVGETPMRFVTQVRLEVASRLLGQGDLSMAQVAARCGFADQAHLSRTFKQHLGISPSQFRSQLQHA
ncbi:helix-turn-helix domain-containing protein [Litoreibacter janthinus]|uniref:Transcriptional regulator, AraC family n=1 Tax=Litoreibacter janthinus TaxID=670154 RepID=A0A1I6HR15_9RHOB|nr:AraC family transcriptional regulator [Litoreibacter janthinus]SFR56824.1 transcriptional regulator, AraC family [Litoreibacter janthinus]